MAEKMPAEGKGAPWKQETGLPAEKSNSISLPKPTLIIRYFNAYLMECISSIADCNMYSIFCEYNLNKFFPGQVSLLLTFELSDGI